MKAVVILVVAILMFPFAGHTADIDDTDPLQRIFLECRHFDGPTQEDDLRAFAKATGLSNTEMSEKLIALVRNGLGDNTNALQRQLTYGALGGLAYFGGDAENDFVREVMRTTSDPTLRHIAVRVGIRMKPKQWEEWVREACSDERFDSLTRFDAYEEAFRIAQRGDELTRRRVEQVLSEFADKDPSPGNCEELRKWSADLKAR
ncbi:MAG: hypothetical protein IJT88_05000 [Kiritimatiellae bacterium]|nr:hypothetical protein [Kiritimatiellia bacterium]